MATHPTGSNPSSADVIVIRLLSVEVGALTVGDLVPFTACSWKGEEPVFRCASRRLGGTRRSGEAVIEAFANLT